MVWGIAAAVVAVIGVVLLWVWRQAALQQNAEAYKGQNEALEARARDMADALVKAAQDRAQEDRLSAEEIVRKRDAAGAARMLSDSTRRKPN